MFHSISHFQGCTIGHTLLNIFFNYHFIYSIIGFKTIIYTTIK